MSLNQKRTNARLHTENDRFLYTFRWRDDRVVRPSANVLHSSHCRSVTRRTAKVSSAIRPVYSATDSYDAIAVFSRNRRVALGARRTYWPRASGVECPATRTCTTFTNERTAPRTPVGHGTTTATQTCSPYTTATNRTCPKRRRRANGRRQPDVTNAGPPKTRYGVPMYSCWKRRVAVVKSLVAPIPRRGNEYPLPVFE